MCGTPIGRSVHVGLDVVSGFRYGVRARQLQRAGEDAAELAAIAAKRGFDAVTLRDDEATARNLVGALGRAAAELRRDDTFVLTFSGHGRAAETSAGLQQSWLLYEDVLVRYGGDGLDAALARFSAGVRILIIADCCFASTAIGRTPPTPRIGAYVVRIGSCSTRELALDSLHPGNPSPFLSSFKNALHSDRRDGFFPFFERLCENSHREMTPQMEIGRPRSESFLAAGPFRLA